MPHGIPPEEAHTFTCSIGSAHDVNLLYANFSKEQTRAAHLDPINLPGLRPEPRLHLGQGAPQHPHDVRPVSLGVDSRQVGRVRVGHLPVDLGGLRDANQQENRVCARSTSPTGFTANFVGVSNRKVSSANQLVARA